MRTLLVGSLLLLTLYTAPALAQRTVIFPEFASGGGWSSEFFFTNQGLSQATGITVSFFSSSGGAISVNSNIGANSTLKFALNAGATQLIKIQSPDAVVSGYAIATYPASAPIRASVILRCEQNGVLYTEVSLAQQEKGDHFSFPVENSGTFPKTALALVNPVAYNSSDPIAQTIILNLIKTDGTIQSTQKVTLQPGEHLARYVDELFPNAGVFAGSMSVSSPFGVGVLALRQENNSFYPIAVDGGPVLGAFMLSSAAILEIEPNDTEATAQNISGSAVIAGTIWRPGDQDVYKFTGKAGDIVSVICTTLGLASNLDSIIEIWDSNKHLIATNDQNGLAPNLYPQNDSFIQTVLPTDDAYFIRVVDFWNLGDPKYVYRLHIRLQ
jgi:hypothetical protein